MKANNFKLGRLALILLILTFCATGSFSQNSQLGMRAEKVWERTVYLPESQTLLDDDLVARLINQLGNPDYGIALAAEKKLASLGPRLTLHADFLGGLHSQDAEIVQRVTKLKRNLEIPFQSLSQFDVVQALAVIVWSSKAYKDTVSAFSDIVKNFDAADQDALNSNLNNFLATMREIAPFFDESRYEVINPPRPLLNKFFTERMKYFAVFHQPFARAGFRIMDTLDEDTYPGGFQPHLPNIPVALRKGGGRTYVLERNKLIFSLRVSQDDAYVSFIEASVSSLGKYSNLVQDFRIKTFSIVQAKKINFTDALPDGLIRDARIEHFNLKIELAGRFRDVLQMRDFSSGSAYLRYTFGTEIGEKAVALDGHYLRETAAKFLFHPKEPITKFNFNKFDGIWDHLPFPTE